MEDELSPEVQGLLRQAAELGPGYHGRRREASATERDALRAALVEFKQPVPAFMEAQGPWIERRAKLFEAGDYPDKGVAITTEDLQKLAGGFDLPVPVLIEHAESPLQLGYLTSVEALGGELFGTVSLTPEANALVEKSGARSLSVGLSPELDAIREVSLVKNPRVESARLFSGDLNPLPLVGEGREGVSQPPPPTPEPPNPVGNEASQQGDGSQWRQRYEQLQRETQQQQTDREIDGMVKAGRLTPAQVPFAKAILGTEDAIEFDGTSTPLRQLLIAMLERQPPHTLFKEVAPQPTQAGDRALLLPEEVAFYERHFPGVSLDSIAAMR